MATWLSGEKKPMLYGPFLGVWNKFFKLISRIPIISETKIYILKNTIITILKDCSHGHVPIAVKFFIINDCMWSPNNIWDQNVFLCLRVERSTSPSAPLPVSPGASVAIFRAPGSIGIGWEVNPGCLPPFPIILKQPRTWLGTMTGLPGTHK